MFKIVKARTVIDVPLEGRVLFKIGIGLGWYINIAFVVVYMDRLEYRGRRAWPGCRRGVSSSPTFRGGLPVPSMLLQFDENVAPGS
jgi:hypothetical protein